MVIMLIYVAKINEEVVYVGQTTQKLKTRVSGHKSNARKGDKRPICRAIRKYGSSIVFHHFVDCATQEILDSLEVLLISTFRPRYNIQKGGKSGFTPWNKGRKETRKQVIRNISNSAKGRISSKRGKYSEQHIKRMSDALRKRLQKPFVCENTGEIFLNKATCGEVLGIDPRGISICLLPTTRLKSYKGYRFKYI